MSTQHQPKYGFALKLIAWCVCFCASFLMSTSGLSTETVKNSSTHFVLDAHFPYQFKSPLKPFHITYKAVADFGITINGQAWERLEQQGDVWIYQTEISALGNKSGEKLVFEVDKHGYLNPLSYNVFDSGWTKDRVRALTYHKKDMSLSYHDSKHNKTSTHIWEKGSFDALSMRLVVMDLFKQQPQITTIAYGLLDGDELEARTIQAQKRTIKTLTDQSIHAVGLTLEDNAKQKITLTLAPRWHYLPVRLELRKPAVDVMLETQKITYDGTLFLQSKTP